MYVDLARQAPLRETTEFVEDRRARKQTDANQSPSDEGVRDLVHRFRKFRIALWLSPGR